MLIIKTIYHKYLKILDYLKQHSYESMLSLEEKGKKKTEMW